jgi:hypothetical protein
MGFKKAAHRAKRGVPRKSFHILLEIQYMKKLVRLSRERRISGADVVRQLIEAA